MVNDVYKFLSFVRLVDLSSWSTKQVSQSKLHKFKFDIKKLGTAINRKKDAMTVIDDDLYKRITIKMNCNGVHLRDIEKGINILTKNQYYVSQGQLAISKIDARNGAFGIIPIEADNAIITGNFWVFDVNVDVADIKYLTLLLSTEYFINVWLECSNGGGNRLYLQEKLFTNYPIPLPDLAMQKIIVDKYNKTIMEAEQNEKLATELEESVDRVLFDELGIEELEEKEMIAQNYEYLKILKFSNISSRWELDEDMEKLLRRIYSGKYKTTTLFNAFKFTTRTWNKKGHKMSTFNYIEIGGIDSELGIIETKELNKINAPSRATQLVETGDLIIGTTRPNLKKFAMVDEKYNGYICSSGFQIIKKSPTYNLEYLISILKSEFVVKQFVIAMTGALYPAINQEQLKQIIVPLPPLEIQEEVANKIFAIKEKIKTLRQNAIIFRERAKKEFEEDVFGEA